MSSCVLGFNPGPWPTQRRRFIELHPLTTSSQCLGATYSAADVTHFYRYPCRESVRGHDSSVAHGKNVIDQLGRGIYLRRVLQCWNYGASGTY